MDSEDLEVEFQQTTSRASIIGVTTVGAAILGFTLNLFISYYFGAAGETDAFIMAQSTSELLLKLLLGGSIAAVFLPMFVERIVQNRKDEAWHLALNLLHITSFILMFALGLLAVFAGPFVRYVIAPGFSPETVDLT
ncbi:MAG: lipid II flippase MurJ, partial [Patescibacteria group bacterium]